MTEKEYYSEKRVSSSSLKWFETSPLFFRKMLDKEIEQETKRYFEIGKKIHMKLLEPDEFTKNYLYLEFETPKSENQRKFCEDYITTRSKTKDEKLLVAFKNNYSSDKLSDEKILEKAETIRKDLSKYITYLKKRSEVKDILTYTDNALINSLEEKVKSHQAAVKLLYLNEEQVFQSIEEFNEKVIFFDWMEVQCKSMLDRIVIDHTNKIIKLVDIKTTSNLGDFIHSFDEFAYYRQMAFYWGAILNEFKYPEYKKETYIVALQKGDLPECRVFSIEDHWLQRGLNEIETILPKIKWHYDNNLWEHSKEYYDNNGVEIL
jgi:hypothetical protein